jgi:hypothetical protein
MVFFPASIALYAVLSLSFRNRNTGGNLPLTEPTPYNEGNPDSFSFS